MKNVIVNADDFGLSESVNEAIKVCFQRGYINRTTAMVNMPAYTECYKIAQSNGFEDKVGLHLNLDEGSPLTDRIKANSHFCKNGVFIKGWYTKPLYKFYLSRNDRECLKEEICAQMKKYRRSGFKLNHLDFHHFVHTSSLVVISIICKLAKEYGFESMRTVARSDKEGILKKGIKKHIHRIIARLFNTTSNFAPYSKYPIDIKDIEYMAHPDVIEGEVVDVLDRKTLKTRGFESLD